MGASPSFHLYQCKAVELREKEPSEASTTQSIRAVLPVLAKVQIFGCVTCPDVKPDKNGAQK